MHDSQCHFQNANFGHSCSDIHLDDGHILVATCGTADSRDPLHQTALDLNTHVNNDDGVLGCAMCYSWHIFPGNCNFAHSCQNMHLDGTKLVATCNNNHDQPVLASIDLNNCVENVRGTRNWMCNFPGI